MATTRRLLLSLMATVAFLSLSSHVYSHDGYEKLKIPGTGNSCCNDTDCKPVRADLTDIGWRIFVKEQSRWILVPDGRILNQSMPNGGCHACYRIEWYQVNIYCFVPCGPEG